MKQVFLIVLEGTGVTEKYLIVGFISRPDREVIANYIKNQYKLILQDMVINETTFSKTYYRKYTTNNPDVNVCVEICYNLDQYENE